MDKHRKQDSDSGVSSDNGDKRLSATEVLMASATSPRLHLTIILVIIFLYLQPSDEESPSMPRTDNTGEDGIRKAGTCYPPVSHCSLYLLFICQAYIGQEWFHLFSSHGYKKKH